MNAILPLLKVGTFGTHLAPNPVGSFSFVGSVHAALHRGPYATEREGIAAFVQWFKAQDANFQREHIGNVRNDVFKLIMEA